MSSGNLVRIDLIRDLRIGKSEYTRWSKTKKWLTDNSILIHRSEYSDTGYWIPDAIFVKETEEVLIFVLSGGILDE